MWTLTGQLCCRKPELQNPSLRTRTENCIQTVIIVNEWMKTKRNTLILKGIASDSNFKQDQPWHNSWRSRFHSPAFSSAFLLNSGSTNCSAQTTARVQPAAAPCHAVFHYFTGMYELLVLDVNHLNMWDVQVVRYPNFFLGNGSR